MVTFVFLHLCFLSLVLPVYCFNTSFDCLRSQQSALSVGFGWFGSTPSSSPDDSGDGSETPLDITSEKAGVASVMASMDKLKTSQRIGKMTASVVQDLSSLTVEGSSANGKVKVTVDGQQLPLSTQIDEAFAKSSSAADVSSAVTEAMKDAHRKSTEKMEEKMKSFFSDLGLPSQR